MQPELRVAVIAAGERWPEGNLRPAVEDQWGAGSVLQLLRADGWSAISPEANTVADTFCAVARDLAAALYDCARGRELISIGYVDDVETATQLDSSSVVPRLQHGAFTSTLYRCGIPDCRILRLLVW
jgi:2-phosphosulfolactate phosphatase